MANPPASWSQSIPIHESRRQFSKVSGSASNFMTPRTGANNATTMSVPQNQESGDRGHGQGSGVRSQGSVFECRLTPDSLVVTTFRPRPGGIGGPDGPGSPPPPS